MAINTAFKPRKILIKDGESLSTSFRITSMDKMGLYAPGDYTGVTTLEVSLDEGVTWRNPTNEALTVAPGACIDANMFAPCCALYHYAIIWRLNNSVAVSGGDKIFTLVGIK